MLAGPPRLVSGVTVLLLLCLAWYYLRLVHVPTPSGLKLDARPPPTPFKGDALDFSIPLRFKDGITKPSGANYTFAMVIPKTKKEDISWMEKEIPEWPLVVYEVDNPEAKNKVPQNKGREAMVCSTCYAGRILVTQANKAS
jgi:hypothetical protein